MPIRRELIAQDTESLRFLHFELHEFRNPRHHHRQFELTWIERGSGLRLVGDSVALFAPGDLVLVGPDVPHTWLSEPNGAWPLLSASVVQFAPDRLQAHGWPELGTVQPVLAAAARGLRITGATHAQVTARLVGMRPLSALGRLAALLDILDALVCGQNDDLQPLCEQPANLPQQARQQRIGEVLDWVHRNIGQELPVAEASRIACVSVAAFSRYFRREVGKPYTTYVNDLRCSEACVLLRQTPLSIPVIASRCGFGAVSNFNRQFLGRTGHTPRGYRALAT